MRLLFALAAVCMAWGSAESQAATIVQNDAYSRSATEIGSSSSAPFMYLFTNQVGFTQFDPALGNLKAVDIVMVTDFTTTAMNFGLSYTMGNFGSSSLIFNQDPFIGLALTASAQKQDGFDQTVPNDNFTSLTSSGSAHTLLDTPSIIAMFIGTGAISAQLPGVTSMNFSNTASSTYSSATISGNVQLTYIYDAATSAVPEPAAWAMMLIGFGAAGAALRLRRRTARAGIAFA